jgi:C-terminal processing protease CtpA/Prc
LRPDALLPSGRPAPRDAAFEVALAFVSGKRGARAPRAEAKNASIAKEPSFGYDKMYKETPFPDLEHRILALVRFWNVIHFFYPYLDLLDEQWDGVLVQMIPRFEEARNEREYVLAVRELTAEVQDSHVVVFGTTTANTLFGAATFPFQFQMLDGQPVVTGIVDDETRNAGLAVGDVLVSIDGESLANRAQGLTRYIAAATPLGVATLANYMALLGPAGSRATLTVLGQDRTPAAVTLTRGKPFYPRVKTGDVVRIVEGDVGVVDLSRLEVDQVDAMFDKVMGTKALVFDLRGFPKATAFSIAPRLNRKGAPYASLIRRPVVLGALADDARRPSLELFQALPVSEKPRYAGRVLVLIDERAISLAEHTALFFESACDATFVGSPTTGTDGPVTVTSLPGGLWVQFTGDDVRHVDGRRLQRVGIQPDVPVRPTIAGIRAGRDEVLEKALSIARGMPGATSK